MSNLYGYNTSTARKIYETDWNYGHNLQREIKKEKNTSARQAAMPKRKAKSSFANFVLVAAFFAMAYAVVGGFVAINEANNEISSLANEYNDIVASNQAIQVKIDKAVDLGQLQTVAGEKFGMVRPERYQMFYVDLEMSDYSENASNEAENRKKDEIAGMGAPGVLTGTLNIFR